MSNINLYQGESFTIGFRFDNAYTIGNLESLSVHIFGQTFIPVATNVPQLWRLELSSNFTESLTSGFYPLELTIDDIVLGVKRISALRIFVKDFATNIVNTSINLGYNLIIDLNVDPPNVVNTTFLTLVKGDKGDTGEAGTGVAMFGETPIGLINNANATFSTLLPFRAGTLVVRLNGLVQALLGDYNILGSQTFSFYGSPEIGDFITVDYLRL